MKQTLLTTALALGLGLLSTHSFASGVQQGAWVVNGYGIAPAEHASFTAPATTEPSGKTCYYVLDVLLCD